MYRIDRMGKDGVVLFQFILCILYIHVRNSDFGSGYAGLGNPQFNGLLAKIECSLYLRNIKQGRL